MKISPIVLTKGGFQREKENTNRFLLIFFLEIITYTILGTYDMVDMVWKLGTYIKVEGG